MPTLTLLGSLTVGLLLSNHGILANPLPSTTLVARYETNYVDCTDDQKTKLKRGFGDAAQLARWMYDNLNTENTAYDDSKFS